MPLVVPFDNCLIGLTRVSIVTNSIVGGDASSTELLRSQLSLVLQLHILSSLYELTKGLSLCLQCLIHRVISALIDQYVLVDGSIVLCLDGYEDEQAETLVEDILLTLNSELLSAKMIQKGTDGSRAYWDSHHSSLQIILLIVADQDSPQSQTETSLHIKLSMVES